MDAEEPAGEQDVMYRKYGTSAVARMRKSGGLAPSTGLYKRPH